MAHAGHGARTPRKGMVISTGRTDPALPAAGRRFARPAIAMAGTPPDLLAHRAAHRVLLPQPAPLPPSGCRIMWSGRHRTHHPRQSGGSSTGPMPGVGFMRFR
ncbi:protein of unknown function [Rhodovastum atsumiense]|nr:protein of unknown function [Rhodovastum atsumiense]